MSLSQRNYEKLVRSLAFLDCEEKFDTVKYVLGKLFKFSRVFKSYSDKNHKRSYMTDPDFELATPSKH